MLPSSTTPLNFFRAIGDSKLLELCTAAQSDPVVLCLLLKAGSADRIRRDDPDLRQGLNILVGKQLLTQAEVTQILGEEIP